MGCGTSKVADDENNISAKNNHKSKELSDGVTSATYLANGSQSSIQNNREKIQSKTFNLTMQSCPFMTIEL